MCRLCALRVRPESGEEIRNKRREHVQPQLRERVLSVHAQIQRAGRRAGHVSVRSVRGLVPPGVPRTGAPPPPFVLALAVTDLFFSSLSLFPLAVVVGGVGGGVSSCQVPDKDAWDELVCRDCAAKHRFLNDYKQLLVTPQSAAAADASAAAAAAATSGDSTAPVPQPTGDEKPVVKQEQGTAEPKCKRPHGTSTFAVCWFVVR